MYSRGYASLGSTVTQWNPDFSDLQGRQKWIPQTEKLKKLRVEMQCLTKKGKRRSLKLSGVSKTRDSTIIYTRFQCYSDSVLFFFSPSYVDAS